MAKLRPESIIGQKFGYLTVISISQNKRSWSPLDYDCQCDCGNITHASYHQLVTKPTNKKRSCGCMTKKMQREMNEIHGLRSHRLYRIYTHMKERCYIPSNDNYPNYGGRGITICSEWLNDFQAFYDWAMGDGYSDDLTLDRERVNENYEPGNCRWVTMKVQGNNRREHHLVEIGGRTQTLQMWIDELGINSKCVHRRIWRGWNDIDALTLPVKARKATKNR